MIRRLIGIAAIVSLFLGVGVLAWWVRSYFSTDCLILQRGHQYRLTSNRGSVSAVVCSCYTVPMGTQPPYPAEKRWPEYGKTWEFTWERGESWQDSSAPRFPGVRIGAWTGGGSGDLGVMAVESGYEVRLPHWMLAFPLLAAGLIWLRRASVRRHRLRAAAGLCVHCGYDLRASRDRCPECGTPVSRKPEAIA